MSDDSRGEGPPVGRPEDNWKRQHRFEYQHEAVGTQRAVLGLVRDLLQLVRDARTARSWPESFRARAGELASSGSEHLFAWLELSPSLEWEPHWRGMLELLEQLQEFLDELAGLGDVPGERLRPLLLDFQTRFIAWQRQLRTSLHTWRQECPPLDD